MRRVADPASPRYQNPARGHRRFRRRRLPGPASAVTKEAAAAAAAAKVSPADVEPGPHRPTHTHFNSLARRRAYHGSAPCDAPPGGGTTEAPPRASSDWPPRCHHHVAGSWQGVCVCLCVCVCVCVCARFALSFVSPSLADVAGLAEHSRILRKGPRRLPDEEDAASSLHKDAADRSFSSAQKRTCRKPRPRDFIGH